MDITLERILSLIPKKPNGDFVHGAKKKFCEEIGAPTNIVNEWVRGVSKSYRNYLYQISAMYHVSVEWLKGETDIKSAPTDGERIPHEKRREILAGEGVHIYLDADAKLTAEQLDDIVNFIQFQQEKNNR